jgi:3-oxoadipate enol-lactonase
MPTAQVGTHRVYYDKHGSGHILLLIPGLGATRFVWWKQIEPLSKKYDLINMDNRDAGDSALGTGSYTIADMADDAAGLIQSLNCGPAYVVGSSMGGFIALELTLHQPKLVKKLILVATSAGGETHALPAPEIGASLMSNKNESIEMYVRRTVPLIAAPGYMESYPNDLAQLVYYAKAKPIAFKSYQRQLSAVMTWRGVADRLNQLTIPTLVIHGDADPLVPYANGQYLAEHIKGGKFLIYRNVGHLLPIEAADQFNKDVMEFLS